MKTRYVLATLCAFFWFGCISSALGDNVITREQYTVKINNITMMRDTAESLLRYIFIRKDRFKNIVVLDQLGHQVLLPEVEKNSELHSDHDFLVMISELHSKCFDQDVNVLFEDESRRCVLYVLNDLKINFCINKSNRVVDLLTINN